MLMIKRVMIRVDDVADKVDTNVTTDDLSNDVNENDVNVSSQQLLQEQKDDLSLKGCFKNAESDRAGFTFVDGLVYRKQKILGETVLQLLVSSSRRKHVLELAHDTYGGHQGEKKD